MVVSLFDQVVQKHPEKTAIRYHGRSYRFIDLYNLSNKVSNWLEMTVLTKYGLDSNNNNLQNGNDSWRTSPTASRQIGIYLGNIPELPSFMMGISRVHGSSVMFNTSHRNETLLNAFKATNCRALIFEKKYLPVMQEVASQLPDIPYFMYNRETVDIHTIKSFSELTKQIDYYGMRREQLANASDSDDFAVFLDQYPTSPITTNYSYSMKDKVNLLI